MGERIEAYSLNNNKEKERVKLDNFNFELETRIRSEDMPGLIADACREMEENLKPLHIKLSGKYDNYNNLLTIVGKAFDNEEIHKNHIKIFYDIFLYLPIDVRGKRYRFELTTYSDVAFKKEKHSYYMETALDKLPDTAGITRQEWEDFTSQLIYRKDGKKMHMPPPTPFYDEYDELEHK